MAHQAIKWQGWTILFCLWGVIVSACEPVSQASPAYSICTPTAADANVYAFPTPTTLNSIYQFASNQTVFNANKTNAQYHALTLLREQVERWSSFQDVPVGNDLQIIRITITYLDPELLQVIMLNELLTQAIPIPINEFNNKLSSGLNGIAKRDELLFLVTVTTSKYDSNAFGESLVTLNIPIREMRMINSSDIKLNPKHDDHPLDQIINISHEWISGYIAYPIAVQVGDNCHHVMASQWNTTMIISVDSIEINGEKYDRQLNWTVKYHSLLNLDISSVTSAPPIPANFNTARLSFSKIPPTPDVGQSPTDENYWNEYWEEMARYVWGYVVDP